MKKVVYGIVFFALCGAVYWGYTTVAPQEKQIVVVIPSYNNIKHYQKNLESVFTQKNGNRLYKNWSLIYTDDCSTDGTYEAVVQFIKERGQEHRCRVIKNEVNKGAMANDYHAIHLCPDDAVVAVLDGDDALAHEHVFEKLSEFYRSGDVWLTYGQFKKYPSGELGQCVALPDEVVRYNAVRRFPFVTSHLRTFYAGLFKKIKREDLMYNGEFFRITSDLAFMFPMVEMAGAHARFIPEVMYIWNMDNPINDFKKDIQGLLAMERVIRGKRPYERLERLV